MKVADILSSVDMGVVALPEFQRGYVWNGKQVRNLLESLYRGHPVGSLLIWVTAKGAVKERGEGPAGFGTVKLLLDGQQRVTSLYGVIRGKEPPFFHGDKRAFLDLWFNVDTEEFQFYGPLRMANDPCWINVTRVMQEGPIAVGIPLLSKPDGQLYLQRLNSLAGIKDREMHAEEITGTDKTVDVVVDIFNAINSGGTKLSKGDLALAKICAAWPEARGELHARLSRWRKQGFSFELDWLLRCVTALVTKKARFEGLADVETAAFADGLKRAETLVDQVLNLISSRLGLNHDRVLAGRYALIVMCCYLDQVGGKLTSLKEQDRLLYWYVHSFLWGRYAGSTETVLNQDLLALSGGDAFEQLVQQLRLTRGDLVVRPEDFSGSSIGARFYPLLYLLTRVQGARDWGTGLALNAHMLGKGSKLHVHHVFPKAQLYKQGHGRREVNAVANFCFLTAETNMKIGAQPPAEYMPEVEKELPGALASQWVPADPLLWQLDGYEEFLAARRALLAQAANGFLDALWAGSVAASAPSQSEPVSSPTGGIVEDEVKAAEELQPLLDWVAAKDIPEPVLAYEIASGETGQIIAVADAAWPNGVQAGLTEPVALLLDGSQDENDALAAIGFRVFGDVTKLRDHLATHAPEPAHLVAA